MDIYDLAAHIVGIDYNEDYNINDIEALLLEKHDIDLVSFKIAVNLLLPYTPPLTSPLSNEQFHTFGIHTHEGKAWIALAKLKFKPPKDSDETPQTQSPKDSDKTETPQTRCISETVIADIAAAACLDDLLNALQQKCPVATGSFYDCSCSSIRTDDLPTWGDEPEDTMEIYSWDETRLLVYGPSPNGDAWQLVPRNHE